MADAALRRLRSSMMRACSAGSASSLRRVIADAALRQLRSSTILAYSAASASSLETRDG